MGSGLSMSSVNKIKELAAAHEYGLALDIVDSQDLSKSLNPQFLRLCGDIYTYNKRYTDARRVLIMAHKIAPEAKRIIFSLVELYLKLGYMELAKTYYDMYMFDADMDSIETKQLQYVYSKSKHAPVAELETYLGRAYDENIDYEWSYETFLVYSLLDKQQEALTLALEYTAHFTDAPHCHVVADVLEGLIDIEKVFYDNVEACEDDDPEQEELRREENKLLEADHLRMNPPEPEIVSMVDDNEDLIDFTAKRKRKRFMKEQAAKETEDSETSAKDVEDTSTKQSSEESVEKETTDKEEAGDISTEEDSEEQTDSEEIKHGFFKRAFSKLRLKDKTSWEEDHDDYESEIDSEKALKDAHSVFFGEDDERVSEDAQADELEEAAETKESEETDDSNEAYPDNETDNEMEDISDIQEMLQRKKSDRDESQAIVSDDFIEDGFEAESDSIEGLHEQADISEKQESSRASKNSVIFEEVELAEEDEDDVPADDFSSDEEDEFGAMSNLDDEYEGVFVGEVEGLSDEEDFEETSEEIIEETEAEEPEEVLEETEIEAEEP
ncbi:MAG: hypothetical protein Q4D54_08990, partial [Eubacteriales bacterium]|nr:hypothetical protein [Eubacteriales bacterium]